MKNKNAKTPDWVRAFSFKKILPGIEKIGFTTLGILLALWVNNCDEGRKKHEIEQKTLLEIQAGLEQDRRDLQETIGGYDYRVWNIETIFDLLGRDSLPQDSLTMRVNDLIGYSFLLANTAAYETLKSRGLETVTNDSLRLAITTLYDVDYEAIQTAEKHLNETHNHLLLPYLISHIKLGVNRFSTEEVRKIKADQPFQQILWQIKFLNQATLDRYQNTLKSLEKLLRDIDRELNNGRF